MSDDKPEQSGDQVFTILQRELVEQETQYEVRAVDRPRAYALLLSYVRASTNGPTDKVIQVGVRVRKRTPSGQPTTLSTRPAILPIQPIVSTSTASAEKAAELTAKKPPLKWPFKLRSGEVKMGGGDDLGSDE